MDPPDHDELCSCLSRIARRRVFFGHQSVGHDIIEGLAELAGEFSIHLNVRDIRDTEVPDGPVFAHARIGRNGDPASKMDHFGRLLDEGLGRTMDAALAKLCYVDVTAETDTEALARLHDQVLDELRQRFPRLGLIPVTVPLTAARSGVREWVARALGHTDPAGADNRARARFNQHLRERHGASGILFDLAAVETGRNQPPDGQSGDRETDIPVLHPTYTHDGGHLNARGRRIAATALVGVLGRVL